MSDATASSMTTPRSGTPLPTQAAPRVPIIAFGMSLGLFLAITFALCVGFDLLFPGQAMYESWLRLLRNPTWEKYQNRRFQRPRFPIDSKW